MHPPIKSEPKIVLRKLRILTSEPTVFGGVSVPGEMNVLMLTLAGLGVVGTCLRGLPNFCQEFEYA